ncbi:YggS family pyridoxal phosphate-dependent enzyme [Stagnihabitans tardus]|uniref:Pyridoxal phosphate homeostasis protein n=1 Tax=Stagnihabitans tardus TaxID=2699202 RepID=A0AAE5BWB0_9RHOB|nr:YggS family pyridoxal phosphate-dependent enzyme [Stagnihabitans tardus]NBZ88579.1 YggS family pyridoxal phosphate-dependent enzyme [Stagnihabitans tardus]
MSLAEIRHRLTQAEAASGRAPGSVTLVAVSKVQPDARVREVLTEGQRVFGENYVQEAGAKWPGFRADFPGVELHMIGPLQTNKAKQAVELFDVIQSLDRPSLAQKLASLAQARGKSPGLFIQVNTGSEPQKAGILPQDLGAFVASCRTMDLSPQGLMCIPPEGQDPVPHFAQLAKLAADNGLPQLSMGMSSDFETAVAMGATHIRVGSALFGARSPKS